MIRGRKPKPTALRRAEGNPGRRGYNANEPVPPEELPDCPVHLNAAAEEEWHRLAEVLYRMGVLTTVDRAVLAAYCQSWGRWVEAEGKLKTTPMLLKTATGYVQQSPWLSIANKQLELMGRFMTELGLTPAARSRVAAYAEADASVEKVDRIEMVVVWRGEDGKMYERPLTEDGTTVLHNPSTEAVATRYLDGDL